LQLHKEKQLITVKNNNMKLKFFAAVACIIFFSPAEAQQKLPIIKASKVMVSIRENGEFLKDSWRISPQLKPDEHVVAVKGKSTWVTFITDLDSIAFKVKPGDRHQFYILWNGDSALTEIKAEKFIPAAAFSKKYKKEHNGKTYTEIPEVYELVNVAFALTRYMKNDKYAVEKGNDYYKDGIAYFGKDSVDEIIKTFDTLLGRNLYARLKMDAYAFEFNKKGNIVQSKIYDRVSWGKQNVLRPYIPALQQFADKTNFRNFFEKHQPFYDAQIRAYRDSINTKEMVIWLNNHFPSTRYNSFKIIWSPLVGGNQSATWFENNGFKEAQQHVNFPYHYWYKTGSKESIDLRRGNIIFTELNHAFINPEGAKDVYREDVLSAFANLETWGEKERAAAWYPNAYSMFNEYLNWGLVSLRYVDYAPKAELDSLIEENGKYMAKGRGFKKFDVFNRHLVQLYKSRKEGETIADLYPKIVAWFKENK
jgi:hypothetical protein